MAVRGYKTKLKGLTKNWKATRKEVGDDQGFTVVPTGNYDVENLSMELDDGKSGLQIKIKMRVCGDSDQAGQQIFCTQQMESGERSLEFVMRMLNFFGYSDFDDLENIEEVLAEITGRTGAIYSIYNKSDGNYCNVSFKALIEGGEGPKEEEDDDDDDDDDDASSDSEGQLQGSEKVDLDDMDKTELISFAEEIGFKELGTTARKVKKLDEDDLRDLLESHLQKEEEDTESKEEVPNLDDMDMDALIEYIESTFGWKEFGMTKRAAKKADEDDLRDAIEEALKGSDSSKTTESKSSTKTSETNDQETIDGLINILDSYGFPTSPKDTLAKLQKKVASATFPKKELSLEEIEILKAAGLAAHIK